VSIEIAETEVPLAELVPIDDLKVDGENPNRMSKEQLERLKTSIRKWRFIVPIVANRDLVVADGEQRLAAARALGMKTVSVIRLPVDNVDRKLLRQVLNKLKGEHEALADAEEFERIIEGGRKEELQFLLGLSDDKLQRSLDLLQSDGNDLGFTYEPIYQVVIDCKDEMEQEEVYNKLTEQGIRCQVLTL
jgi:ParB-like chromosome segregation protein Spo0J